MIDKVFSREEHTNWVSNIKWSVLKICLHARNIIQTEQAMLKNIYVYVYMYILCIRVTRINENIYDFERE